MIQATREMAKESVQSFTVEELCDYLADQGQHQDVVTAVVENRLAGRDFLELTSDHLKELFSVLGTRMSVQRLISSLSPQPSPDQPHQAGRPPVAPIVS